MPGDEKIEKYNSFLVILFIFFFRYYCTAFLSRYELYAKKRVILLEQDYLVTCTIYEAPVTSINTTITTLGVCLYNVLEVCQV